jgi:hypothetical protein
MTYSAILILVYLNKVEQLAQKHLSTRSLSYTIKISLAAKALLS